MNRESGKAVWWLLAACGLVVALAVLFVFVLPASATRSELAKLMAEARHDGIPVSPDDMRPHPPVPESENAGPLYEEVFPTLGWPRYDTAASASLSRVMRDRFSPDDLAEAKTTLAKAAPALDKIERASKRPYCDFHWNYEEGQNLQMPQLSSLRSAARYFCLRARLEAEAGNPVKALQSLRTAGRIEGHLNQLPFLISSLLSAMIERQIMGQLRWMAERYSRRPEVLKGLQQVVDSLPKVPDLHAVLKTELFLGLQTLGDFSSIQKVLEAASAAEGDPNKKTPSGDIPLSQSFRDDLKVRHLKLWLKILREVPAAPKHWSDLQAGLQQADQEARALEGSKDLKDMMIVMFMPSFSQMASTPGWMTAERHMATTSLRLFQERIAKGRFPETLPNYGPTSIDPIDERPLRYRLAGSGFEIYSVGADGRDNGGAGSSSTFSKKGNDDVWLFTP